MGMVMTCNEVWQEISNYLDNDLDPASRIRMDRHLADCAECNALLISMRDVIQLAGDGSTLSVPAGFSSRVRERLKRHIAANRGGLRPSQRALQQILRTTEILPKPRGRA